MGTEVEKKNMESDTRKIYVTFAVKLNSDICFEKEKTMTFATNKFDMTGTRVIELFFGL